MATREKDLRLATFTVHKLREREEKLVALINVLRHEVRRLNNRELEAEVTGLRKQVTSLRRAVEKRDEALQETRQCKRSLRKALDRVRGFLKLVKGHSATSKYIQQDARELWREVGEALQGKDNKEGKDEGA